MFETLRGFFVRPGESVRLRFGKVWVRPATARFLIDTERNYKTDDSEEEGLRYMLDLMRESIVDRRGRPVFGQNEDPASKVDAQEFTRLQSVVRRLNTFGGEAEKNSPAGHPDDS